MCSLNLVLAGFLFVVGQIAKALATEDSINCTSYRGQRPFIYSLNTALPQYLGSNDPRVTSVDTTKGHSYLYYQFNCTYNKPIQWVFHLDPDDNKMNIELDFSERILRKGKHDELKSVYSANFRILFRLSDLGKDMLFSCEPVPIYDFCERNFLQLQDEVFENHPTPFPKKSLSAMSDALLKASLRQPVIRYFDSTSCPLILNIKIEDGNIISYRWETWNNSTNDVSSITVQTNETSYLENLYRFNETKEPHCVRVLNETEDCLDCRDVGPILNYTINAVILRATYENITLVYKGLFSVPKNGRSERKFCKKIHLYINLRFVEIKEQGLFRCLDFDWQISDSVIQKWMIQLAVPERVYANVTFKVVCRVSVFLFSYGTQISDKESPDPDESTRSQEVFKPNGYREVIRELTFQEPNKAKRVSCFSPLKKYERYVMKSKAIIVELATPPAIDDSFENTTEFRTVTEGLDTVVIHCNCVSGNPTPNITWILPKQLPTNESRLLNMTRRENYLSIQFPKWKSVFAGTYTCEARNFFGVTTKSITFQNVEGSTSNFAVIISSSLGSLALLLGISISILAWKISRQRHDFEIQTQKAIEEFKNGIKTDDLQEADMNDPNFSILQLPYNESFEIPLNNWVIQDKILGTGQFGVVRMGSVIRGEESITVAIKSLKSSVEIDEFKSFLFELKIMAYLGHHKNIVSLIAACTEGIDNRDIMIGVEYCDDGSLLDYLRKYRGSFLNMVGPDGNLLSDFSPVLNNTSQYANISMINTHQLYRWSYHIACGMEYLRVRKVLHGDLAARNVLLTTRKVAKVGDFGLSRVLMNSENYTKQTKTALPWKWMAIESLSMRVFSFESDVWAYGVCLYEIFTLGQSPYPGISWSPDFITQLQNGMRMEKPVYCTASLYKVMRTCWENDPHNRPGYAKIKRKLNKGLQRMSALIIASKEQQQQRQLSSTRSTQNQSHHSTSLITRTPAELPDILGVDDAGLYSNIPRRTMNYYKNC